MVTDVSRPDVGVSTKLKTRTPRVSSKITFDGLVPQYSSMCLFSRSPKFMNGYLSNLLSARLHVRQRRIVLFTSLYVSRNSFAVAPRSASSLRIVSHFLTCSTSHPCGVLRSSPV